MATFGSRDTETTHGITERAPAAAASREAPAPEPRAAFAAVPIPQSCCLPLPLCPKPPKAPTAHLLPTDRVRSGGKRTRHYCTLSPNFVGGRRTVDASAVRTPSAPSQPWRVELATLNLNRSPYVVVARVTAMDEKGTHAQ